MPLSPHRLALAGLLTLIAVVGAIPGVILAATDPAPRYTHPIVVTALKYEGAWGGQCWTFMQRVVFEATGREVGFDYRQGFFDAGASEVPLSEAREGDIIQVADDRHTSGDADYSGLHTAIVMENKGGGEFKVIDSNANWDEVVRVREGYNPTEAAARYGNPNLRAHAYRIPVKGAAGAGGSSPAAGRVSLAAGDRAVVAADGDGLNLRKAPGTSAKILTKLADSTAVTVLSQSPVSVDGRDWVNVSTPSGDGWVAAQYLKKQTVGGASTGGQRPITTWRVTIPIVSGGVQP